METPPKHPLVALQFNLGAAPAPKSTRKSSFASTSREQLPGDTKSVHVGRHLIYEYLKQSIIPDPAFIALQDVPSNVDVEAIRNVLQQRRTNGGAAYKCVAWHGNEDRGKDVLPAGKKAALLYNENILICDKERLLVQNDFFHQRDAKAELLFKRLDGGLFLHKPSNRFIVAVSYHGEKNGYSDDDKKECIAELLLTLVNKYEYRKPMLMVFGDFNLDLEQWKAESLETMSETCLVGWDLYPTDCRSTRDLRSRPIDYVLVHAPGTIEVKDDSTGAFSPLPVEISGAGDELVYRLSTKDGHHENNEAVFTTSDLKGKKIRSAAPLHEYFKSHEPYLRDVKKSKHIFDHDFIYLSMGFISTITEDMTPEVENLLRCTTRLTLTPTKDKVKKKPSKEGRECATEAANTLQWLKNNPFWIQMAKNMLPNEWAEATHKLLSENNKMTLQEVLLWLKFP